MGEAGVHVVSAPPSDGAVARAATLERRRLVGRNIVILLVSQVVTWSLALVLAVFEPRFLGADGLGQLRLAVAIWALVNVFAELGTSTLLTLEFARDPDRARALIGPVLRLRAAGELLGAVVVAVLVAVAYDAETGVTIAIVGAGTMIALFGEAARASLHGLQWMGPAARADIVAKLVLVLGTIAVLVAGGGARDVALVQLVPIVLSGLILWKALGKRLSGLARARPASAVSTLRRSSPYLTGMLVATVYAQIDIIIISIVADVEEAGWYAAAGTLFGSLLFIPNAFTTSLFPALAQLHVERPEAPYELLARAVRSILLLAVPMGIGTMVVGDQVATAVLGGDFDGAGPVLALYGVVLILMFQTILFGRFAFAIGRHRFYIAAMAVAVVLTLPLDLLLVPWTRDRFDNGAIGGVLATIITESMLLAVAVWKLAPQLLSRATIVRVSKVTAAGAALAAAAWPLREQFLAVPVLAGAFAYLVVLVLLRTLDAEDRELLRRLRERVASGRALRRAAGTRP